MLRQKIKLNFFKNSKGGIGIVVLIVIIILGSTSLIGGIFPKTNRTTTSFEKGIPDMSSVLPGSKNSLQLKTLKFQCPEQITVDLLLDKSVSMSKKTPTGQTKIARLKEAVLALTEKLNDQSVIGIQSFRTGSITDDVPISYYKDVKGIIPSKVNAYNAARNTPTHDALAFSLDKLREAIPRFPGRQFNFVLVSDGAPCPGVGCAGVSGQDQDPRLFNPNPADEIKNLGVNVYTLGIFDSGQASNPKLAELLKSVASKPENYFEAQTGDQATKLLEVISARICDQAS